MSYRLTKLNHSFIYAGLILLLFLSEALTTFVIRLSDYESIRLVGFYKIIFLIIIVLSSSFLKINKRILTLVLFLVCIYLINQFLLQSFDYTNLKQSVSKGALYYLVRYIYIFVFIAAFLSYNTKDEIIQKSIKCIELFLFTNSILIVLGAIFDMDFFKSYPKGIRFGYDGLFNKVNEVSYLYCIYISHIYYSYIRKGKGIFYLFFIILSSLLIGTKAVLLFLGLLFSYHILFSTKNKKVYRFVYIPLFTAFIFFIKPIMGLFFESSPQWGGLLDKHGVLTVLTSTRDLLFYKGLDYVYNTWSFLNGLFGGPYYTIDFNNTEIGFFDLFIFFGALGTLIYSILFYKCFIKNKDLLIIVLVSIILIVGLLAGGLFLSVTSLVYMYFISYKYDLKNLDK